MKEETEEKILANLYMNLKGPKKKKDNWIKIAQDCQQLTHYYGSAKMVAEKLGVHYEIIRSLLKLLMLPEEVKQLIRNNQILFDVGQRIARLEDKDTQIRVAKAVVGLPNHDAREVIQFARKYPNVPLDDFKKRVVDSKGKVEKLYLAIIPLKEPTYELLKKIGKKDNLSLEKLILKIVNQWLLKHEYDR